MRQLLGSLALLNLAASKPQVSRTITGHRTYCDNKPCQNDGTCHTQQQTGKWFCECASGWNGPTCEIPNPELKCGTDVITVLIDKRMIVGNKLENKPQLISFGESEDDECKASLDGEHYRLVIKAPFGGRCGTTASRADGDSGDYIFSNDVTWRKVYQGNAGEAPIQRKIKLVDFNCHYEDEYLLQMIPLRPAEMTVEQETAKGNFQVDMTLWKNSDFERDLNAQYSSNPIVRVGHEVCVKLEVDSLLNQPNLVLTASDCWASAISNPSEDDKHFIINKKCISEADYTTTIKENGVGSTVKFCFKVYKWNNKMDDLYVQCKMSVCDDSIQVKGHSQCVCPPQSYDTNDWFYPNYYEAQIDYLDDKYSEYYNYGEYYADYGNANGDSSYGGDHTYGDQGNNDNYGMFYYDYTYGDSGGTAYDMIKRRRKRSTEEAGDEQAKVEDEQVSTDSNSTTQEESETETRVLKQEQGGSSLPTKQKNTDLLQKPAKSLKRKRLEFNGTFKKDDDGNLVLPKGIKIDESKDLIEVGYGPIIVKDELDELEAAQRAEALADIIVAQIDDPGEWFETSEGANNVVLIAVGGSLIFAIIVLGIVIGVYVQFKNQADQKNAKILEEKQKVKAFVHGVMKEARSSSGKSKVPIYEPETVSTVTEE